MRVTSTVRVVGVAAAAVLTTGLLTAGAAQAVPVTTVSTVTFSSQSLTVSGLAMGAQTVSAHITTTDLQSPLLFDLTRTGGSGTLRAISASPTLTSGAWGDGTWTATVYVPSTADGTWTLSDVVELQQGAAPTTDVTGAPTFTVHGSHQPRLSIGVVPNAYPSTSGVIKGRVVDSDTGQGMAGVPVGYARDTYCTNFQGDSGYGPARFLVTKSTDAAGYYSFVPSNLYELQCVGIWGAVRHNSDTYSVFPAFRTFNSPVRPAVTAGPASTTGRVLLAVVVSGTVRAPSHTGMGVIVQRLHGRTAWRDVATTTVRESGRWTSIARPTVKGRNIFRAITQVTTGYVVGTSRTFTVTGS